MARRARAARRNGVALCSCAWEIEDCKNILTCPVLSSALVLSPMLWCEAPKPSRRRGCRHARAGRWCGVRGGTGRRGRCYGMYPIDPRLSRVAQRSVPRAFAGVMWGRENGHFDQSCALCVTKPWHDWFLNFRAQKGVFPFLALLERQTPATHARTHARAHDGRLFEPAEGRRGR